MTIRDARFTSTSGLMSLIRLDMRAWTFAATFILSLCFLAFKEYIVIPTESIKFSHVFGKRNTTIQYPTDRYLNLEGKHVVVLGDSQMNQLAVRLTKLLGNCVLSRNGSRCGELKGYMGLRSIPHAEFIHPGAAEGPVANGFYNLGRECRDCRGCEAKFYICKDGFHQTSVEYIAVEFARDVSLQSTEYRTTQENVALYLSRQNVSYVIYNTGLHDTALKDASVKAYEANLLWYSKTLKNFMPAAKFLWVDTVAVVKTQQPPKWRNITNNQRISSYNRAASHVVERFGFYRISPFEILHLPYFAKMNTGGTHYFAEGGVFYDMLAFEILEMICRLTH